MSMTTNIHQSVLSDKAILRHYQNGMIIISPFDQKNLATSSYDVTLGEWYYRETIPEHGTGIYNPYDKNDVLKVWGKPVKAKKLSETDTTTINDHKIVRGIGNEDLIIWIGPGETILAHTNEFIGGKEKITTMMKARSSMGRNFIEVCKCAGWGDVGYYNRWTMEITNNSKHYSIPLVVGRRIAQIVFFETEGIIEKDYSISGKYQNSDNLESLIQQWNPENMIPKMYNDREVVNQ